MNTYILLVCAGITLHWGALSVPNRMWVYDRNRSKESHIAYPFSQSIPLVIQTLELNIHHRHLPQQRNAELCSDRNQMVLILLGANRSSQVLEMTENIASRWKFCRQKLSLVFENEVAGEDTLDWLERVFRIMWQNKIPNVVAVLKAVGPMAQMFTYVPFTPTGFRVMNIPVANTNIAIDEVFPNRVRNLYGTTLTVSMEAEVLRVIPPAVNDTKMGFYGVDGDMAELIRDRHGFPLIRISLILKSLCSFQVERDFCIHPADELLHRYQ